MRHWRTEFIKQVLPRFCNPEPILLSYNIEKVSTNIITLSNTYSFPFENDIFRRVKNMSRLAKFVSILVSWLQWWLFHFEIRKESIRIQLAGGGGVAAAAVRIVVIRLKHVIFCFEFLYRHCLIGVGIIIWGKLFLRLEFDAAIQ